MISFLPTRTPNVKRDNSRIKQSRCKERKDQYKLWNSQTPTELMRSDSSHGSLKSLYFIILNNQAQPDRHSYQCNQLSSSMKPQQKIDYPQNQPFKKHSCLFRNDIVFGNDTPASLFPLRHSNSCQNSCICWDTYKYFHLLVI